MNDATNPAATGEASTDNGAFDEATTDIALPVDEATTDLAAPGATTVWLAVTDGGTPPPRVSLGSVDDPEPPRHASPISTGRYQLIDEIARGGMGAVMRGRDSELNRMLAVKVLLEKYRDNDTYLRRFFEEAQIGGQLQHPGIVPIYDLGVLPDRRPFFAMKLVKGQTLSVLLKERKTPSDDLPRFLAIFGQVAQTVAYAHSRGVIHRDLKPLNVMVGAFGEIQVMDWGLAKVLSKARAERPNDVPRTVSPVTATGDSTLDMSVSVAGSVLGTPAFMAPEQARGEKDKIDERTDVFGLGSMLCDILTGAPAYVGRNAAETARKAEVADLADAHARLDASAADDELVDLARRCLAPEMENRPRDASVVAMAVTDYLASVQDRLRVSELGRVQAEAKAEIGQARAESEKARRKTTMVTAAATLLAVLIGGGTWFGIRLENEKYAAESNRMVAHAQSRAESLKVEAERDGPAAVESWDRALAAADEAKAILAARPARNPLARDVVLNYTAVAAAATEARERVRAIEADRRLLAALDEAGLEVGAVKDGIFDPAPTCAAYEDAFRQAGIVFGPKTEAAVAARLLAKPDVARIAAALDDWAGAEADQTRRDEILAVARIIDPVGNLLRDAVCNRDRATLEAMASDPASTHKHPTTVVQLANALSQLGATDEAMAFLKAARAASPGDFRINHELAMLARLESGPSSAAEAVRYFSVAVGLRPLSPGAHLNLSAALSANGQSDESVASLREAIRLKPDYAHAHCNLSVALLELRRFTEAEAAGREAIRLVPNLAEAHANLGNALVGQGRSDDALASLREAVRIEPHNPRAQYGLGSALHGLGRLDEAAERYRNALHHEPDYSQARTNLANILDDQGKSDEAEAAYRETIRRNPRFAPAHYNLGNVLSARGQADEAIEHYREAIRLAPDYAEPHCNLGLRLKQKGQLAEALVELKRGHELGQKQPHWPYPSAQWLAECEAMIASEKRLEAILRGEFEPRDDGDRMLLGQLCYNKKQYAASARFWGEALAHDPKIANNRAAGTRYNAACSAVLAGGGQGEDSPQPNDAARVVLRKQGRDWLRAELSAWKRIGLTIGEGNREAAVKALNHWKTDADLAGVRDDRALAKLPEEEQAAWKSLWVDVDALLAKLKPVQ